MDRIRNAGKIASARVHPLVVRLVLLAVLVLVGVLNGHNVGYFALSMEQHRFARFFFTVAAHSGHAGAQNNLAGMYAAGLGGARDTASAARWYERAARQGVAEAQFNLSNLYESGDGVTRNTGRAVQLLEEAATAGDVLAAFNLGNILATGRDDYPKDTERAVRWYRAAAEQGYASAQYNLGALYAQGKDVAQDLPQAALWFSKAASQDHAKAQMDYGSMLAFGVGVDRQFVPGIELLRRAEKHPQTRAESTARIGVACSSTRDTSELAVCPLR